MSPCKDCTKRQLRCHSVCPEYIEFAKGVLDTKETIKANRNMPFYSANYGLSRSLKRKNKPKDGIDWRGQI